MADWVVRASSTSTFGRVLLNARHHHLVVDGPERNGCPGEAITPAELLLGGVVTCAVELISVIAKERGIALNDVDAEIEGTIDREHTIRDDITIFSSVALRIRLDGVGDDDAGGLVAAFQGRCPLYGTLAAATPDVQVTWTTT